MQGIMHFDVFGYGVSIVKWSESALYYWKEGRERQCHAGKYELFLSKL